MKSRVTNAMKKIPEIKFNKESKEQTDGFELIVLEDFIARIQNPVGHNPFRTHRLNFFMILIITDGEVHHSIDFKTHHLQAGDAMVISKGQIHAFDEHSNYKGYMLLFTQEFMQKYIAKSTMERINNLYNYFLGQKKINNAEQNDDFVRSLHYEIERKSPSSPNIMGALLSLYLLKINDKDDQLEHPSHSRKLDYFNQFRLLVEKNFSKTRNAKVYASDLSISYKFLNEVSKATVRSTAKSFIDNYVILEAKRMLITTAFSVKEIAYSLGFDEVTNFTKFFKKHTATTPLEFRKI